MNFDIFSKRNSQASSSPLIYQNFPLKFKNQLIHLLHEYIGEPYVQSYPGSVATENVWYKQIDKILREEWGHITYRI